MEMSGTKGIYDIQDIIRQSPPLDLSSPLDDAWVKDKTIIITGGASGFGEGFFRRWAAAGACVIIGDINVAKGDNLVREVSKKTGNQNLHFFDCDVYVSLVNMYTRRPQYGPKSCRFA